jgi:hypothetical protein
MTVGSAGRTFTSEINRLANGGTYPAMTAMKADQGAANTYASTSGLGLVGALNLKASGVRTPAQYKGLNAVCNELAGTSGKSAVDALRSMST